MFITKILTSLLLLFVKQVSPCKVLSLSGGGSYGAFEMGIVSKLIESDNGKWDLITGVSAGSINAGFLSTIDKYNETKYTNIIKDLWLNTTNSQVYSNVFFLNGISLYQTKPLQHTLDKLFLNRIPIRPIIVSATSLKNSNSTHFYINDFKKFGFTNIIMASTAIPILFPPFEFNNDIYVDGGITSNILMYEGIKYCINNFPNEHIYIDVIICGKQIEYDNINKLNFSILIDKLFNIIKQQIEYFQIEDDISFPTNKITINIYQQKFSRSISLTDFTQSKLLWEDGYTFQNVDIKKFN
jgi:predicted patatin/cPLA2 family phospholipase